MNVTTSKQIPPLRLAFVGGYGHHYLRGALADDAVSVDAVAVVSDGLEPEAVRRKFAPELAAGASWYDAITPMLDDFRPNVVNIGGVFALTGPLTREVVQRGVAAVSDKPLAASWEELARLEAACAQAAMPVLTEFDFRCRPSFRAAQLAVRAGRIGKPVLATAQKSYKLGKRPAFFRDRKLFGSTLLWIASHGIDVISFATGERLERVVGMHGNVAHPEMGEMEDHCIAMYALSGGGHAVVHADYLRPTGAEGHGDDRLRIAGSRGVVEVRDGRCVLLEADRPAADITAEATSQPPHRAMLEAALLGETAYYSTRASLEMARVLLASRDAADERKLVPIDTDRGRGGGA